jgi:hypothetical protein
MIFSSISARMRWLSDSVSAPFPRVMPPAALSPPADTALR